MSQRSILAAALLLSGACATGLHDAGGRGSPGRETTVSVENRNWADMNVYVVRAGARTRLGMVTSMNRATFAIPQTMTAGGGDIALLADPIGSSATFQTEPILLAPGQHIVWLIENSIQLSSLFVR
ncbi:MAG: hypothetical protein HY703_06425 [Gemmatimonadetes bacterium]|nr:hypothetical protein [Gemmatimonadota bacterium]